MQLNWAGVDHWVVSLGCGLLIGVVSERREHERLNTAGTRTHAITALLGCAAWELGVEIFIVALLAVAALTVAAYWHSARNDPGLTSEVTLLFTLTLGALSQKSAARCRGSVDRHRLAVALVVSRAGGVYDGAGDPAGYQRDGAGHRLPGGAQTGQCRGPGLRSVATAQGQTG